MYGFKYNQIIYNYVQRIVLKIIIINTYFGNVFNEKYFDLQYIEKMY